MYILIIAIISPFIFVNSYQIFDHFHETNKNALAKEGSTLWRFLSRKLLPIIILSLVSVFIAISLAIAIKDVIYSDNGRIVKIAFFILFVLVLVTALFKGKNNLILENVNQKTANYMQNFTSSISIAFGFSIIMFIISFYLLKIDLGVSLEQYLVNNMPKEDENNLIYIVESISVLKTYFIYYSAQVLGENLIKALFSILLFIQTLFIFYYSSIIVKTIKNVTKGTLPFNWYSVIPMGLSFIILLLVPDYKKDVNSVLNLSMEEKAKIISNKDNEIKALRVNKDNEIKALIVNYEKKLKDAEAKFNLEIETYKNRKVSSWKTAKSIIMDCTVSDII